MVSADTIRTVLGIVGNVTALGLFLSPAPTFCQIRKKKSVEQFSPMPYIACILNCTFWVLYGLPVVRPHSVMVATVNGAGLIVELMYVFIFLLYCDDGKKRMRVIFLLLFEVGFTGAVAAFTLLLFHTHDRRSFVVGSLCVFFSSLMYAAPLSIMKMVIKTRSVEYLPFYLSVTSFVNGVCWLCYALIHFDLFILIPNSLGALFALIQLLLHAAFYKSTKRQLEEKKAKSGTKLSEIVLVGDSSKICCNAPQKDHDLHINHK